jgi:ATP-dependent DNA helicase RecQ
MVELMQTELSTSDLLTHFKLTSFRRGQSEIITSVLNGKDVLAVLPTGGGKSLCYQYPSVVLKRLVVVVSPLIALMKDQVDSLTRLGIPTGAIHSGQTEDEKRDVFRRLREPGGFVLYVSPERVAKDGFQSWISKAPVGLFALDEAHCVSQWGHDFRQDYAQLRTLKELRPDVPILALTASATPFVLNDIAKQLGLKSPLRHVHGFYRPNLYYQVEACANDDEKFQWLVQAIKQFPAGRVLIYCGTRAVTEELSNALATRFERVAYYHAGLSTDERTQVQNDFASGLNRILVATNAFGMGIDHPDVRLVVHFQIPANIDALYQEMGRAGRDGLGSTCLLLYSKKDKGLQSFFIQNSKAPANIQSSKWRGLDNLISYAEGGECRHAEILTYYQDAQRITRCEHCDTCDPTSDRRVRVELQLKKQKTAKLRKKPRSDGGGQDVVLVGAAAELFESLRNWRREKARELDVPAFVVLSDRSLRHLADVRPTTADQLKDIYGLGEVKIEKFGTELLAEIHLHSN